MGFKFDKKAWKQREYTYTYSKNGGPVNHRINERKRKVNEVMKSLNKQQHQDLINAQRKEDEKKRNAAKVLAQRMEKAKPNGA